MVENYFVDNFEIDNYYSELVYQNKVKFLRESLKQNVLKKLKRYENSHLKMKNKMKSENDCDKYRFFGDLIMANLYNNNDYVKNIEVFDWKTNQNILIELDETKTLKDNANIFYKIVFRSINCFCSFFYGMARLFK